MERRKIHINGTVQGVGFRPFVYKLATDNHLTGFVTNTPTGVDIEVQGGADALAVFLDNLRSYPPPLALLTEVISQSIQPIPDTQFSIRASEPQGDVATQISSDTAICDECLTELFDPDDRRYRYPFINCTNCGPRYTIIENIPYDRSTTSMRNFEMCEACKIEYEDRTGRRFHTQPNCCSDCGPYISLHTADRQLQSTADTAISDTIDLLQKGSIVAIKGLGGFHLAVDATNEEAVIKLRQRKGREEKPFAIMVDSLTSARTICNLDKEQESLLLSVQSPILLADKSTNHFICEGVAPCNDMFGIMLPYTPLHHLLLQGGIRALVMTSGNYSDEPICANNADAFERLGSIADYFLLHNRDIYLRNDDSIVIRIADKFQIIRRGRGYSPRPLVVEKTPLPVLAVGGELKNTICMLKNNQAIVSQHIGDLKNLEAYTSFQKTIEHLQLVFQISPKLIVHDLHPGYLSTRWAKEQKEIKTLGVQHHHAHLAACLAENNNKGPAIGIIMDGTGYGSDGSIWGGEILVGDSSDYSRYACLEPMPLPGGDAAIAAPWRTAVAYLFAAFGDQFPNLPFLEMHDRAPILEMVKKQFNTPMTSSCGRLFDAIAALCGGRQTIYYEAQAAIELMQAAGKKYDKSFSYDIIQNGSIKLMSVQSIIKSAVAAITKGEPIEKISRRFHQTLIELFTETVILASVDSGIRTIALSGGVFQNRLLVEGMLSSLNKVGFSVLTHSLVPTNDGCISLGQAMIGRKHLLTI